MSMNSSPPLSSFRPRADAVSKMPPSSIKYAVDSPPMMLCKAEKYFHRSISKAFHVREGSYSPKGREGVAKGE